MKQYILSLLMSTIVCSAATAATSFKTVWKTTKANETVTIPMIGNYDYRIDNDQTWGKPQTVKPGGAVDITFLNPGDHTVAIRPSTSNGKIQIKTHSDQLIRVTQWGSYQWASMENAFNGASNLDVTATDLPNLTGVTNMKHMFGECSSLVGNSSFTKWNTSSVQFMEGVFTQTKKFNQSLSGWNTSAVTTMNGMFNEASAFNQPLDWNTSAVRDMAGMFNQAVAFNGDISNWNTAKVTNMSAMFLEAAAFNKDISKWETSKVTNMSSMFNEATLFNQPLNNWDTSAVTTMAGMFDTAPAFNQPLNSWDTAGVSDMTSIFYSAKAFDQNISAWSIASLTTAQFALTQSGMSGENYTRLLRGWAGQANIQKNVSLNAGTIKYFKSATDPRGNLTGISGWTITDGGLDPDHTLTPVIGMTVTQTGTHLTWVLEKEVGVKSYEVYNLETKTLVATVTAEGLNGYSIDLPNSEAVYLKVVDNWGTQVFIPQDGSEITTAYELEKGWNLISIPSDGGNFSRFKHSTNGKIWGWNGSSYVPATKFYATEGIWVFAENSTTVYLTGHKSKSEIKLKPGWNMTGPTHNSKVPTEAITTFTYDHKINHQIKDTKLLESGIGYWIFAM